MTETEIKETKYTIVNDLLKATSYMTDEEVNTVKQIKDNCYNRYNQFRKTGQITLEEILQNATGT